MENNFQLKVAEILINIESIKFSFEKPFTLTSGLKSPVYVDCRKIISFVKDASNSKGVMSLKDIPSFGKSGIVLMTLSNFS